MKSGRLKKTLMNMLLLFVTIFIFYSIAELVIRGLYPETVLYPRYHTDAQYGEFTLRKTRPNYTYWQRSRFGKWKFTINSKGLRNDREFAYEKPEGTLRVLSLGDSHAMGYEVRQDFTYSAAIKKFLNTRSVKTEVINAGVSGFSTAEALLYLENEGIKYQPDVVVLGFFANDYEDNVKTDLFRIDENGVLRLHKKAYIPGVKIQNFIYGIPFIRWLSSHSYFYSLLFNRTWLYLKTRAAKKALNEIGEVAIPTQNVIPPYQADLARALMKRLYNFCQANAIKLIILDIPMTPDCIKIRSSLSEPLEEEIDNYCDASVKSIPLLKNFEKVAEIHWPHGHWHISEFTHTLMGVEAAKAILTFK